MAADPTRAALEAAALEISARHLEWDGKPPEVWDGRRHMAAAAVAAFHYKRADDLNAMGREYWPQAAVHVDIAAAVEAAAREGSDA